jgi:hypothetical protein
VTQPVLDLDFAPSVWVVGPNDSHPFDTWIGPAVDRTLARFELPPGPGQAREVVTEILTRIGTYQDLLAYFVLHWPSPLEPPLPLYLGLHERVDRETIDAWLGGADLSTVEQPLVDSVPVDREGVSLLRSLPYSNGEDGSVVIGARYVVDVGHDDMIVLARTASFAAKSLIAAQSAVVELLSSVRVVDLDVEQAGA